MKKLLIATLFLAQIASAQRTIHLEAHENKDTLPVSIQGIQVLVACGDTTRLGYVQVGMMNKRIPAVPDKPLSLWLQQYVDGNYHHCYNPAGGRLLWVIRDLRIAEFTGHMSEHAYVRLKADAFIATDEQHYVQVAMMDTVLRKGGMDVTSKHGQNIAAALEYLFKASGRPAQSAATLTIDQLMAEENKRFDAPVYHVKSFLTGVYLSYQEFLDNTPSVATFGINTEGESVTVYAVNADSSHSTINKYWGVCTSDGIYKFDDVSRSLIPIDRDGNSFVISGYLDASRKQRNRELWTAAAAGVAGGAVGGAIGGAAAGAATAGNLSSPFVYYVTRIPYIKKNFPEASIIDADSGELMF